MDNRQKVSKFDLLTNHIAFYQYDILGISETWLDDAVDADLFIQGYQMPFRRDFNRHQRGIMVYVADSLPAKRRMDLEPSTCEIICIEVQLNKMKVLVCNCYRVQYYDVVDFGADIECIVDKASADYDGIYIMGDMNARNQKFWDGDITNTEGRAIHSIFTQLGMKELISEPTRCVGNTQSCIDLIFTNNQSLVSLVGTKDKISEKCDHLPIFAYLTIKTRTPCSYKRWVWDFKRGDYDKFRQLLLNAPWHSCYSDRNVDETVHNWTSLFTHCAEQCVPHYEATIRPGDKPFMSTQIRKLMRKRDSLRLAFKHYNDEATGRQYRQYRNMVVSAVRQAKEQKQKDIDSLMSSDLPAKKWWKICKQSIGSSQKSLSGPMLDKHGNLITDNGAKAELLNDFFVSQSVLNSDSVSLPQEFRTSTNAIGPLTFLPEDVYKILSTLDINKATGSDGIGNHLLREAAVPLAQPLAELLNFSLSLGIFPTAWKVAQVVPIFKKNDPLLCTNYRPISLLPCLSKVFEKLLFDHIFSYLKTNRLLTANQSGFVPGDSTVNQLMSICNNIASHFDQGEEVIGVFLDLTKAFDKVWHEGLKYKLRKMGICGQVYNLLCSYLHDRKQFVSLNGSNSQTKSLHAGVPQGSVLGPLLFLVYINDLPENIENTAYLFADDTSIFNTIKPYGAQSAVNSLNDDLQEIHSWAKNWLINIHPQKTVAMLFSVKKNPSILPPIYLGTKEVCLVSSHCHLGITLTPTLNWSDHIDKISSKCYKVLGILKKFKYRWTRKALETCYMSFVRPIIEYGSIIYDSCNSTSSDKLEAIQLEAARLVTGAKKGTSHLALYNELGWLTLKERRTMSKLYKMYTLTTKASPEYLYKIVSDFQTGSQVLTRFHSKGGLKIPICRTELYMKSPIISSIQLWNNLDTHLKSAPSFSSFKDRLRKHYARKPFLFHPISNRSLQVSFMQLRLGFSNLNHDLAKRGCYPDPTCACGYHTEDARHFFLECPLYNTLRESLVTNILTNVNNVEISVDLLMYGSNTLTSDQNICIFNSVYEFINKSCRL